MPRPLSILPDGLGEISKREAFHALRALRASKPLKYVLFLLHVERTISHAECVLVVVLVPTEARYRARRQRRVLGESRAVCGAC